MPRYDKTALVNTLRERTGLEREAISKFTGLHDRSVHRLEKGEKTPTPETFEYLMKAIDLPMEGFIYPKLDSLSMEQIIQCDLLTQLLDIGDNKQAEKLLSKLEVMQEFETGIYKQFVLSKRARLWEQQGVEPEQIFPLLNEAMAETFENLNETKLCEHVLVLEESELLLTRARLLMRIADYTKAANILSAMKISMEKLPAMDKEKERLYAPVLLAFSDCFLQLGDYEKVVSACKEGAGYSVTWNKGKYNPCFELKCAYGLKGLKRSDECKKHLQHAYFGYMIMGNEKRAQEVLNAAEKDFNISFELYGVDKLKIQQTKVVPYFRGDAVECNSIGSMIKALRKRAGLSLEELSQGICNKSSLMRIEEGKSIGRIWNLEAIMQRLGRDIGLYESFFLSKEDFIIMQLRDRIYGLIIDNRYNEIAELLAELESKKNVMAFPVLKQFVLMSRAYVYRNSNKEDVNGFIEMLMIALKITCPKFCIHDIDKIFFSHNEIFIINIYAGLLSSDGNQDNAIEIYERLLRILERFEDKHEMDRMYDAVLFNYSTSLGRAERRYEALARISEGESRIKMRGVLSCLPSLVFNHGYNLQESENKEESIPYFSLAYYCMSMLVEYGKLDNFSIVKSFLLKVMNLEMS